MQLLAQERARELALERLVALLETDRPSFRHDAAQTEEFHSEGLNQLARLRAAHASYTLSTTSDLKRVGAGAWIRRCRS